MPRTLRLGTRGSLLALWQSNWVKAELEASDDDLQIELETLQTTGDRVVDRPMSAIGGKGLFTKELDEALLGHHIDLAVHSLKDVPFQLPEGLVIAAVLPRADARDAFVSDGRSLSEMPPAARIGTSSLRRRAQILASYPDLRMNDLRGNVDTRLRKLEAGAFDGIVLSVAGLERLGHASRISERLDPALVLPAVGQGVVSVICRTDDPTAMSSVAVLDHKQTRLAILAERALLEVLEGGCQVPVGGYGIVDGDALSLSGVIATPDGARVIREATGGPSEDAYGVGQRLGRRLLDSGGVEILDAIRSHGS